MPLTAGTRLGPYEIVAPLGAGGMGEVYRARDSRLNRDVAIKILPSTFSNDSNRMSRFQREALVLAALNHPNIAAIYGLEESGGALVMELVEGPTLAERIDRGAIPLEESLAIARQFADALEAAHEKGIVHRDLKPANIKTTPEGKVKVLDFGLAKAFDAEISSSDPANSPTLTMDSTRAGVILGTAGYMSPEQARGIPVDKRADIWAFGVVFYEMLTGRRLFSGDNISDTLVSVLTETPNWNHVPANLRRLLRNCLEKDPKNRLRDIGDVWRLVDQTETKSVPVAKSRLLRIAVASLVLLLISGLIWGPWRAARPIERSVVTIDLDLGSVASLTSASAAGPTAILSPDGERVVFVSESKDGARSLFTRRLDQAGSTGLIKTEGAFAPFFSPDGQWVGFFAGGRLKKTRVDGGEPVILCEAPGGRGGSWSEDGTIIAALDINTGLSQIPADGGKPAFLTEAEVGDLSHRWPQVLPGGKAVIFTVGNAPSSYDGARIAVMSLVDRRRKIVLDRAMFARYLLSGHLVYVSKGTLFGAPFDPDRLEIRGPATPLLQDLASDIVFGSAQYDVSRNGTVLYRPRGSAGLRTIQWLDSAGKTEPVLAEPAIYQTPRMSPDGSRLAFVVADGPDSDLWVYQLQQGSRRRLTQRSGVNSYEVWSPDGGYLVFQSSGGTSWARVDGADKPQPFTTTKTLQRPSSFLPNGSRLAIFELSPGGGSLIRTVPLEGVAVKPKAGAPELFLHTVSSNPNPAFSPDGRWLAYASADSGMYEVHVRRFPDNGTQVLISNSGGNIPIWSRSSRELFYRTEDQRIMVVTYTIRGDSFIAEKPRLWSSKQLANTGATPNLDIAPDGKRFVVLMPAEAPDPRESQSHVKLAVNFFDEIRRRVTAASN